MNELSIEQKVKAYDEALEIAKSKIKNDKDHVLYEDDIIEMFPVLKENEENVDEKIRKALIEMVNDTVGDSLWIDYNVHKEDAIAWLEKQSEKKHQYNSRPRYVGEGELLGKKAAKIEPKFNIGDKIQYKNKTYTIKEVQENYYVLDNNMSLGFYAQDVWELVEQKYAEIVKPKFNVGDWVVQGCNILKIRCVGDEYYCYETVGGYVDDMLVAKIDSSYRPWTIQDAKDGDVLACNEEILLFKSYSVQGLISLYCWYNGQTNKFHNKEVVDSLMTTRNKICPATKEQRATLERVMADAGYTFDFKKKELKKIEHKTIVPKFKVGDEICWKGDIDNNDTIAEICDGYYLNPLGNRMDMSYTDANFELVKRVIVKEKKWTINDAKDGDMLSYPADDGSVWLMIFQSEYKPYDGHLHYHVLLSDKLYINDTCFLDVSNLRLSNEEERKLLCKEIQKGGYVWDSYGLELKKIAHNPAWSKEDEEYLKAAIWYVENPAPNVAKNAMLGEWVKNLKDRVQPQSQWKPSDEQMYHLSEAAHHKTPFWDCGILIGLYDELKKLKEE